MSTLDLIRVLRRALAGLRDAGDPSAVAVVARALAQELETRLGETLSSNDLVPADGTAGSTRDGFGEDVQGADDARVLGMAVFA